MKVLNTDSGVVHGVNHSGSATYCGYPTAAENNYYFDLQSALKHWSNWEITDKRVTCKTCLNAIEMNI